MTSKSRSPSASLLDEIAQALDVMSPVLKNWYHLAIQLGVPKEDCWNLERRSTRSPTNGLFQYLEATRPQMTLKKLKEILHELGRRDLLYYLDKQSLEGNVQLVRDQKLKTLSVEIDINFVSSMVSSLDSEREFRLYSFQLPSMVPLDKSLSVNLLQCVTSNIPYIDISSNMYILLHTLVSSR